MVVRPSRLHLAGKMPAPQSAGRQDACTTTSLQGSEQFQQIIDNGGVDGRHGQLAQPGQLDPVVRRERTGGAAQDGMKRHARMRIGSLVIGEASDRGDCEANLFGAFTDRSLLGRFAGPKLSPRKFPQAVQNVARVAHLNETAVVFDDQCQGDRRGRRHKD